MEHQACPGVAVFCLHAVHIEGTELGVIEYWGEFPPATDMLADATCDTGMDEVPVDPPVEKCFSIDK